MLDFPSTFLPYLIIPLGYILGSVPASFIIAKSIGKQDIMNEGDGKISASAVNRRMGKWAFLLVVCYDVGKGLFITIFTSVVIGSIMLALIAGLATAIGHNWSVFLKFKGGLGATAIYGAIGGMMILQLLAAFVPGLICLGITRKSGLSTGVIIISLFIILLLQYFLNWQIPFYDMTPYLVIYPIVMIIPMIIKKLQITRNSKLAVKN